VYYSLFLNRNKPPPSHSECSYTCRH